MRINGKISGVLCKLKLSYDEKSEERWAEPHLRIILDRDGVTETFGDDFAKLCFGSMRELAVTDSESSAPPPARFGYEQIKPDGTFEVHAAVIESDDWDDMKIVTQPRVVCVKPLKPLPVVSVDVALPFKFTGRGESVGALSCSLGEQLTCQLLPKQTGMFDDPTARTNGRSRVVEESF